MSTRYHSTYSEGTSASGAGSVDRWYDDLRAAILAYTVDGETPWSVVSTIATRDEVFYSGGDPAGSDIACWIRLTRAGDDINAIVYQDWSTDSETGTSGTVSKRLSRGDNTAGGTVTWYIVVNAYEISFITKQDLLEYAASVGTVIRTASGAGLVGRTTGAVNSGSGVVVPVDRDLKLEVGQQVWIYNLTPVGDALRSGTIDITTVDAITASDVTLNTLTTNFASGAIIGLHPSPNFALASLASGNNLDGLATYNAVGVSPSGGMAGYAVVPNYWTEGDNDPGIISGNFFAFRIVYNQVSLVAQSFGAIQHFLCASNDGTFAFGEKCRIELDDLRIYRWHPGKIHGPGTLSLLLGPGAPV